MSESINTFFENQIFTAAFLASLMSGFFTSFVFLFSLMFLLKPRMKVCSCIATAIDDLDNQTPKRKFWIFKVTNASLFSAFDLKVEIVQKIPTYGPSGSLNYRTRRILLHKDQYPHVAPFRFGWMKQDYSDYALWFITYEDVGDILRTNQHSVIELRLICRHALTGLGNVKRQMYSVSDIKQGTFKSGNTFEIV